MKKANNNVAVAFRLQKNKIKKEIHLLKPAAGIIWLPIIFLLLAGCEQRFDDEDIAIVCGYVYQTAIPIDSVPIGVDSLGNTIWKYTAWRFEKPVESVHVWVETDINSNVPYLGPDLDGYTDSLGKFEIPVFLGMTPKCGGGYEPVYYADVRVFWIYGKYMWDFGGGITLGRGKKFELFPTAIAWGSEKKEED